MIVKLSLGTIKKSRLVLRGGSIIDWRRLDVASMDECNAILCANGFDPEDELDASYLREIRLATKFALRAVVQILLASVCFDSNLFHAVRAGELDIYTLRLIFNPNK